MEERGREVRQNDYDRRNDGALRAGLQLSSEDWDLSGIQQANSLGGQPGEKCR